MKNFERYGRAPTLLGLALLASGCLSPAEPPQTLLWEGELLIDAAGPPDLVGSTAMAAFSAHTEVGIGIDGAPLGATYGWLLRNGTCATPGEGSAPPTAFPALEVSAEQSAEAVAVLQRRITGTEYAVQLVENADGTGPVIACADLTRRT